MVEWVLSGGPWFINGHIVGMEKWSIDFSPLSMKGLTTPTWIRLPHLPLQCWDELNVARISSRIGKPLMFDVTMFQWGRREFARVCIRMKLDQYLPLGVWVESISGRFSQKVEYVKISTFYFECGMIGHVKNDCKHGIHINKEPVVGSSKGGLGLNGEKVKRDNDASYGPWVLVNHKRSRRLIQRITNMKLMNMKCVKKQLKPDLEIHEDRINVSSEDQIRSIMLELNYLIASTEQTEEGKITERLEQATKEEQAARTEESDDHKTEDLQKIDGVMGMVFNPTGSIFQIDVNKFDILSMENDGKSGGVNEIKVKGNFDEGNAVVIKGDGLWKEVGYGGRFYSGKSDC
ncbi:hypothetical protein KFK09_026495 [Dendrobium nobile]|uniref:CCHC-type domain-containing protein n=1 Tax=Dendrobium nobile TaxID=94219 RepID=A0A8T3A6P3_DENNO|nr:hypothetical protein KFK09_026495 [Dendrobium nobile]